jgi:uncharacterized membrane protein YedE/YeeE
VSEAFWSWWQGGIAIGAVATIYPLLTGRLLGVSSVYASLVARQRTPVPELAQLSELEAALLAETEAEFGPQASTNEAPSKLARWRADTEQSRPLFLLGMALGPLLLLLFSGDFELRSTLGSRFDLRYGELGVLPIAVLVVAGMLIGFGTRVAGGCTSGHGISGVARGERGSLLSTIVFWGTALAVTWIFFGLRTF